MANTTASQPNTAQPHGTQPNTPAQQAAPLHAASFTPPQAGRAQSYLHDPADMPAPSRTSKSHQAYQALIEQAKNLPGAVSMGIVWPCEQHALEGALEAAKHSIVAPVLIGPRTLITDVAQRYGLELGATPIIDTPTPQEAAAQAVALVKAGRVQALMKGSLHTDVLMHAVVSPESGLRTARRISHVFLLAVPSYDDLIFVTDAAINIAPDLSVKRDIVQNAIDLHHGLGLGTPRVALLSAVETITPKIPGTVDAAALCKMADRGQIEGGVLDGPLAMDNAVSATAAQIKGITSPVAGRAQILVVPDLEAGNMLAKNMIFLAGAEAAGVVLGASVPILLTSRADSVQARLASLAVGALYARHLHPQNTAQSQ
ncbi:bifunctional enoyl-CoA hydratase/phosphate acetyltransferase [Acetobacter orientalis]|nr:bifunctional enoyl-CoA hydratase/phosphate acetyltransferase [Acetobacter orientalis]MCP1216950.1 bifunctional enoyl-CoA hydratase/phosphate acetyltransferase [Acetobacter orientalis]MCP1219854.1 bifunctional enoyl-CoA hydratase/phosphate acetyltransferase [Acetobacter orientalis]